jgi:hypothetical protein
MHASHIQGVIYWAGVVYKSSCVQLPPNTLHRWLACMHLPCVILRLNPTVLSTAKTSKTRVPQSQGGTTRQAGGRPDHPGSPGKNPDPPANTPGLHSDFIASAALVARAQTEGQSEGYLTRPVYAGSAAASAPSAKMNLLCLWGVLFVLLYSIDTSDTQFAENIGFRLGDGVSNGGWMGGGGGGELAMHESEWGY